MVNLSSDERDHRFIGKMMVSYADSHAQRRFTTGSYDNVDKTVEKVADGIYNRAIGYSPEKGLAR